MNKKNIHKYTCLFSTKIVDALQLIDENSSGTLFVVDNDFKLLGCITDGDIRRWILKNGSVHDEVCCAMSKNPNYVLTNQLFLSEEIINKKQINAVPVVNSNLVVEDVVVRKNLVSDYIKKTDKNLNGVPVVIMAGGKGTRLYPYTKILPKPLIPIGETPIVERIIECFNNYGIDRFYLTVNYKKSMIKSYFNDLNPNYSIDYVEEGEPLGTAGSIKLIPCKFDKPIFVINCDVLIRTDYKDLYEFHKKSDYALTMVTALKNIQVPYGVVRSGFEGELLTIDEKPKLSYFINTGMYVINPDLIELIPADKIFHMTDLVDVCLKKGYRIGTYPISEDSFLDMGEFSEMKRMEEKLNIEENSRWLT